MLIDSTLSLVLTLPILALSPLLQTLVGLREAVRFSGDLYVLFGLSSAVFWYGGWPFLKGLYTELKSLKPGMMTLVAVAITTAYLYSSAVVFGLTGNMFFWELATLVDIMLLGHWIEMKSVMGASKALEELAKLMPSDARKLMPDGSAKDVPLSELAVDDKVLVKPGEKVPADGAVLEGESSVNEAMLTGDNKATAKWVADQVGLDEYFAEVLPQDKVAKVKDVQARGVLVAHDRRRRERATAATEEVMAQSITVRPRQSCSRRASARRVCAIVPTGSREPARLHVPPWITGWLPVLRSGQRSCSKPVALHARAGIAKVPPLEPGGVRLNGGTTIEQAGADIATRLPGQSVPGMIGPCHVITLSPRDYNAVLFDLDHVHSREAHRRPRTRSGVALVVAGVLGLAGCASLPTIVPDLALHRGRAVQLEGARGSLSAARSKAILERLSRRGQPTDIFDRHLALEEAIVGSPLTTGNQVRLLQDGPATFQAMFAAITAARDHINMETYILDDDDVGQRFAQALIDKQAQGVQVNLIRDSVGTRRTPAAFFKRLSDSGVKVLEFNPINPLSSRKEWELNQRDHRKLLVVDGRTAFLGGINISSVYSGGSFSLGSRVRPDGSPSWRDTDLELRGPVVAEFQKLFLATWESQKGDPLPPRNYFPRPENVGPEVVRAIGSSPDEPYSLIYATLLSAIGSAESSVHLTNAYFAPDPQLLAALEAAAGRGVDVRLILPSQTDSWLVFHAGRSYYERLLRAGVKVYERRGVILHSKTALIDGVWATVGSTNLDWRSFLHNYELNAVVLGAEFGKQVQAMFAKDLAASEQITLARWQQRPLDLRIKELLARAWEYWL